MRWNRELAARQIADRACARLAARQIADRACARLAAQPARHDGPFLTARRRARLALRSEKNAARQSELRRMHVERCARRRAYVRARREAAA